MNAEMAKKAEEESERRLRQRNAVDWFAETDVLADLRDPEVRASAHR